SSEPQTNGQVVDGKSASSETRNSLSWQGAHPSKVLSRSQVNPPLRRPQSAAFKRSFFNKIGQQLPFATVRSRVARSTAYRSTVHVHEQLSTPRSAGPLAGRRFA